MAESEFDKVIEQYHRALDAFQRGDAEGMVRLFSHREDVSLMNPVGTVDHGFDRVVKTAREVASHLRDGETTGFETIAKHVTPELAYLVEIERHRSRVDGRTEIAPTPLRVTTIFVPEQGTWKVIHRHADPITSVRPVDSMIQKDP